MLEPGRGDELVRARPHCEACPTRDYKYDVLERSKVEPISCEHVVSSARLLSGSRRVCGPSTGFVRLSSPSRSRISPLFQPCPALADFGRTWTPGWTPDGLLLQSPPHGPEPSRSPSGVRSRRRLPRRNAFASCTGYPRFRGFPPTFPPSRKPPSEPTASSTRSSVS